MHERIAGAQVTPADQQHLIAIATRHVRAQARNVVDHRLRGKLHPSAFSVQNLCKSRSERAEVNSLRNGFHLGQGQTTRVAAETITIRPNSEEHVEYALGTDFACK